MKCPVCKDVNLSIADRQGIEIDYCPECRGVWLDRGELDKIIEKSVADETPTPQNYNQSNYRDDRFNDSYKYSQKKKEKVCLANSLIFN